MEFKIECEKLNLNDPILLIGLPGIGLVGKIVVDALINKTKAKKVGQISGDFFPPIVFISKTGEIRDSIDAIYLLKTEERDFIFISGDFQPHLESPNAFESHHKFASEIADFAKKIGIKEIYSFAGINVGDERITKEPSVYFVTTNQKNSTELKKFAKPIEKETTISGIAGLILLRSAGHKIPATCILGETSSKIYGDFESAKNVLIFLEKHLKLKIDLKEIETEAKKISSAFKQVVKELKSMISTNIQEPTQEKPTYIR